MSCTDRFFIPSTFLSATLYAADTFSDLALGVRFLRDANTTAESNGNNSCPASPVVSNDKNYFTYGIITLVCVFVPYALYLPTAISYRRTIHKNKWGHPAVKTWTTIVLAAAVINLYPAAIYVCSAWFHWKGWLILAKNNHNAGNAVRLVEVVIEAFPQSALQIYIVGVRQRFDCLFIFSIATSLWSVCNGIFQGGFRGAERVSKFFADQKRWEDGIPRGLLKLIRGIGLADTTAVYYKGDLHYIASHPIATRIFFQPWVLFTIVCFLPPVALLASLEHHSTALIAMIYLLVHLVLAVRVANMRDAARLFCGVILQLAFSFLAILMSTLWFRSIAPHVDSSTFGYIPSFVLTGVKPTLPLCNSTAVTATTAATLTMASPLAVMQEAISKEFSLTDIAAYLYQFFVAGSIFLFPKTLILILIWPCFTRRWKRQWDMAAPERERKEAERKEKWEREENERKQKWERKQSSKRNCSESIKLRQQQGREGVSEEEAAFEKEEKGEFLEERDLEQNDAIGEEERELKPTREEREQKEEGA